MDILLNICTVEIVLPISSHTVCLYEMRHCNFPIFIPLWASPGRKHEPTSQEPIWKKWFYYESGSMYSCSYCIPIQSGLELLRLKHQFKTLSISQLRFRLQVASALAVYCIMFSICKIGTRYTAGYKGYKNKNKQCLCATLN